MSTFEKVPQAAPEVSPIISSGDGSPSSTPGKIGDLYIDTSGKKAYIATGTTNSSDWTILN